MWLAEHRKILNLVFVHQGSKSVGKRQREEQEEAGAQRAAKKLRQDMKQRGHEVRF